MPLDLHDVLQMASKIRPLRKLKRALRLPAVRAAMEEAGATPDAKLPDLALAAVAVALDLDVLIDPGPLAILPGTRVDDAIAALIEAVDGPALALLLVVLYRRSVRRGVGVVEPEARPDHHAGPHAAGLWLAAMHAQPEPAPDAGPEAIEEPAPVVPDPIVVFPEADDPEVVPG